MRGAGAMNRLLLCTLMLLGCARVNAEIATNNSPVEYVTGYAKQCEKVPANPLDCHEDHRYCYLEGNSIYTPCHKICPPKSKDPSELRCEALCSVFYEEKCHNRTTTEATTSDSATPAPVAHSASNKKAVTSTEAVESRAKPMPFGFRALIASVIVLAVVVVVFVLAARREKH